MSDFGSRDFLDKYKLITNKLKKRFLRKPNVTEACEEFSELGQKCETMNLQPQAGMCWLAAARCEGSLGNVLGEAGSILRAGNQFLAAEKKQHQLGCDSLGREHMQAAISCYIHASNRYTDASPLSNALWYEIAAEMENGISDSSAENFYIQTATSGVLANDICLRIACCQRLCSSRIKQGDLTGALSAQSDIAQLLETIATTTPELLELHTYTRFNCEILRVLLLLILRSTPQCLSPPLANLLEKYIWGNSDDKSVSEIGVSEELFILLQSLIMACQASDTQALSSLEAELRPFLSVEQNTLLRILMKFNIP